MITTFWGVNPTGATNAVAVDGDIFVNIGTNSQRRRLASAPNVDGSGAGWVWVVPPETRADVIPPGGQINDRVAKVGSGNVFETGWRNAAAGVVGPPAEASPTNTEGRHEQVTADDAWTVEHSLSATFVNVTVIADDGETILVPRVEYVNDMVCILHFQDDVAGTAIIRR